MSEICRNNNYENPLTSRRTDGGKKPNGAQELVLEKRRKCRELMRHLAS